MNYSLSEVEIKDMPIVADPTKEYYPASFRGLIDRTPPSGDQEWSDGDKTYYQNKCYVKAYHMSETTTQEEEYFLLASGLADYLREKSDLPDHVYPAATVQGYATNTLYRVWPGLFPAFCPFFSSDIKKYNLTDYYIIRQGTYQDYYFCTQQGTGYELDACTLIKIGFENPYANQFALAVVIWRNLKPYLNA